MKRLVHDSLAYEIVREEARSVLLIDGSLTPFDYIEALDSYLRQHVIIVDEAEELLTAPARMIAEIRERGSVLGDCDDVAMLGATLLLAIGIRCRFKAIHQDPAGHFRHVFVEYNLDGHWRHLDPTMQGIPRYDGPVMIEEF